MAISPPVNSFQTLENDGPRNEWSRNLTAFDSEIKVWCFDDETQSVIAGSATGEIKSFAYGDLAETGVSKFKHNGPVTCVANLKTCHRLVLSAGMSGCLAIIHLNPVPGQPHAPTSRGLTMILSHQLFGNPIYSMKPLDHELDLQNQTGGLKQAKRGTAFAVAVGSVGIVKIVLFEKRKQG